MNISFGDCRFQPYPLTFDDLSFLSNDYDASMDLLNDFRSQGALNTSQRFGIGQLFVADSRKHPIRPCRPEPHVRACQSSSSVCASTPTSASQLRPALLSAFASRFVAAVSVRPRIPCRSLKNLPLSVLDASHPARDQFRPASQASFDHILNWRSYEARSESAL